MKTPAPILRRSLLAVACGIVVVRAAAGLAADARPPQPPAATRPPAVSGFAPVGDVRMYYEIHGAGEPIVFVHGGGGSVASWPAGYVRDLSRDFQVILVESRGHGRTADGRGPITYGRLTFDVVRLLDHLGIDRAHIVGHSVGAIVGLHLLVDFPDRIRTATLLAGAYHVDNYQPDAFAAMQRELDALIRGETIESRLANRPMAVVKKLRDSWLVGPMFTLRALETIDRPVLVVAAGQDAFFATSVAADMHAHIKGSELVVYPQASHRVQVTNAAELVPAIRSFVTRRGRE